jgi:glycosidase
MEQRLDYIKGLGFDAIWITPIVASNSNPLLSALPVMIIYIFYMIRF